MTSTISLVVLTVAVSAVLAGLGSWIVFLMESNKRRRILAAVRAHPGILASRLSLDLNLNELTLRVLLRRMEEDEDIVTLPERGDRKIWILPY